VALNYVIVAEALDDVSVFENGIGLHLVRSHRKLSSPRMRRLVIPHTQQILENGAAMPIASTFFPAWDVKRPHID